MSFKNTIFENLVCESQMHLPLGSRFLNKWKFTWLGILIITQAVTCTRGSSGLQLQRSQLEEEEFKHRTRRPLYGSWKRQKRGYPLPRFFCHWQKEGNHSLESTEKLIWSFSVIGWKVWSQGGGKKSYKGQIIPSCILNGLWLEERNWRERGMKGEVRIWEKDTEL